MKTKTIKQLALYLEKRLDEMGCDNAPLDDTIAYWIADFLDTLECDKMRKRRAEL